MSANPEQAQQAAAQQRPHPNLIRPEELSKATFLDDATRSKYTMAFRQFWNFVEQKQPGSAEHTQALTKLTEWSQKLRSLAAQHRLRAQQQQAQKNQQAQQGGSQEQQQPSGAAASQNQGSAAQNALSSQQQTQQRPQPSQQQAQSQQGQAQQQMPAQGQGQPQQAQAAAARPNQQPQIPPAILQHVSQFQYALPPNIPPGSAEAESKIKEMRNSYAMSLAKQEFAANQVKRINQMIEQKRKEGQEIGADLIASRQQQEAAYNSMKAFVEDFRKKQMTFREMAKTRQQGQQQTQGGPAGGATPTAGGTAGAGNAQVKVEGSAASGTATSTPGQVGGAPTATAGTSQANQPPATTQAAGQVNAGRPAASPSTSQSQMNGQFTQAAVGQPSQQQPNGVQTAVRPPSLPGQAPSQVGQMPQVQQGSPATQGPPGGPIALTHHAAVTAAARSHSDRTGTPQQASTFRPTPHENPNSLNNPKMPIPKQLSVPPPQPVSMGPQRPTLGGPNAGGPGVMGQPVINKLPAYMLEGDGDRVMSKKKLDELVRQVTGGGEGTQNESLTPEVEEAMLQLADDFVDNVISSACKLSKLRDSQQLDIRDIQLVLERNYNIRIPGYASDEIRTVRKLHPNSAWNEKMKALQAAKIMGGKTDL